MLLLKHILVATDFCSVSTTALRHALGIARLCHSRVSLLHVIDAFVYGITPDGLAVAVDRAERDAEELTEKLQSEGVLQGVTMDVTITVGSRRSHKGPQRTSERGRRQLRFAPCLAGRGGRS